MIRSLVLAAAAAVTGCGLTRALTAAAPVLDPRHRLDRANHSGATVSLIEGPAVAAGLTVAGALVSHRRARFAAMSTTALTGLLGFVDDVAETGAAKGLRGHLGALARGEITTGGLKILGIPAVSLLAAVVARDSQPLAGSRLLGRSVDTVLATGVISGSANLFNLLDLRPGRALKAGLVTACLGRIAPGAPTVLTGSTLGVIAAAWPDDLAGSTMLGDTGANALGAHLGTRAALAATRGQLTGSLAVLVVLTLASEKVSFTRVIESTPGLHELDAWGRSRALPAGP